MTQNATLAQIYRSYISAINAQNWDEVKTFVHDAVVHNNRTFSKDQYCQLMIAMFKSCPDTVFNIEMLVVDEDAGVVACLIMLEATPVEELFGNSADGRQKVKFAEHVFYEFTEGKIARVKSLVDFDEIKRQLSG